MAGRNGEIRAWWLPTLIAIAVFVSTIWVFSRLRDSLLDMGRFGVDVPRPESTEEVAEFLLRETSARFSWAATEMILVIALVLGICATIWYLARALSPAPKQSAAKLLLAFLAMVVVVAVAGRLAGLDPAAVIVAYDSIFEQAGNIELEIRDEATKLDPGLRRDFFESCKGEVSRACTGLQLRDELTTASNLLTLAFVILLTLTFTCVLAEPPGKRDPIAHLRSQQQRIRELLYLGAVLMVLGVIEMYQLWHWHGVHLPQAEAVISDRLARSIAAGFGGFFTAVLLAVYVPSALVVGTESRQLVQSELASREGDTSPAEVAKALESHGFASSPLEHMGRIAALLGPVAAGFMGGPLGSVLGFS
jgi:hypothetical protein